jgi:uncharacterized protein YqeY
MIIHTSFFIGGTGMLLEDKISQDYVQAMKARDSFRSSVLSFLRAQIKNVKVDKRLEQVPDEEVISVIKKQAKQRQDSITQFKAGGRTDLADKEEKELVILKNYLPPEMSADKLKSIVEEVISSSGATSIKDMGRVMKDVLARVAGQADNQTVGALVKERLSRK